MLLRRAFFFPSDPLARFVKLLTHFDGANGQTTYTDSAALCTITNNGAALTTAQKKFGTASLDCDGTHGVVVTPFSNFVFGTGDFTLEAWVRPTTLGAVGGRAVIDLRINAVSVVTPALFVFNNGALGFTYGDGSGPTGFVFSAVGLIATNVWTHVAACRVGTTLRLFVNGVVVQTVTDTTNASAAQALIGTSDFASGNFTGQIDEVRITAAGRYAASFTPPSGPYQVT